MLACYSIENQRNKLWELASQLRRPIAPVGKTYHYLTTTAFFKHQPTGHRLYRYHCVCGEEIDVSWDTLKRNKRKSCGCRSTGLPPPREIRDWSGYRVGRLVVMRMAEHKVGEPVRWIVQCDCGTPEKSVLSQVLNGNKRVAAIALISSRPGQREIRGKMRCSYPQRSSESAIICANICVATVKKAEFKVGMK